jgi:tetratricopeptide (TPR) repeat protein
VPFEEELAMTERSRERFGRVDALFEQALDQPADRRRRFLDEATGGDEDLVGEVLRLLASLDAAEGAIGESAAAFVASPVVVAPAAPGYPPGHRIGPFAVIEELGRGGMGTVYLAERTDGQFPHRVALKSLAPGPIGAAARIRFRREQSILAGLDHPHIARLYDSGIGDDGRPYLVMAPIDGIRIDRWCDEHRSTIEERLRLFEQVVEAVEYAHGRLVVHRDLKPGNILVSEPGRAILLDFGIAKLLRDEDEEPATRAGTRILTPEYAAPEQLRGEPVSTAGDVYSLGVILHQLLTGQRPPWQAEIVAREGGGDLNRLVTRPTVAEAATVAAARQTTARGLARLLQGDLGLIVSRALRPDPADRYRSAAALLDDLRRHREGRPIQARPDSFRYRAGKFVRRNPALAAVAAALVLVTGVFLATSVAQARRLERERDQVRTERDRANRTVDLLVGLFEAADPFALGRRDTLRVGAFLAGGAARVKTDLAADSVLQGELLSVLSRAHRGLGMIADARRLAEEAVALRRASGASPAQLAASLNDLGVVATHQADLKAAEAAHREALRLRDAALPNVPREVAGSLIGLGTAKLELLQYDSAAALFDRAAAIQRRDLATDTAFRATLLNNRGMLAYRTGALDTAVALGEEALALARARFGPNHPRTYIELGNQAFRLDRIDRFVEAESVFRVALAGIRERLGDEHPRTAEVMGQFATALTRRGRWAAAESLLRAKLAVDRARLGAGHPENAGTLFTLSRVLSSTGREREAAVVDREVLTINQATLGPDHFATAIARGKVASNDCGAGRSGAVAELEGSLTVLGRTLPAHHEGALSIRRLLGECLARLGRRDAAERVLVEAIGIARKQYGDRGPTTINLARSLTVLFRDAGQPERAREYQALLDAASPP